MVATWPVRSTGALEIGTIVLHCSRRAVWTAEAPRKVRLHRLKCVQHYCSWLHLPCTECFSQIIVAGAQEVHAIASYHSPQRLNSGFNVCSRVTVRHTARIEYEESQYEEVLHGQFHSHFNNGVVACSSLQTGTAPHQWPNDNEFVQVFLLYRCSIYSQMFFFKLPTGPWQLFQSGGISTRFV